MVEVFGRGFSGGAFPVAVLVVAIFPAEFIGERERICTEMEWTGCRLSFGAVAAAGGSQQEESAGKEQDSYAGVLGRWSSAWLHTSLGSVSRRMVGAKSALFDTCGGGGASLT